MGKHLGKRYHNSNRVTQDQMDEGAEELDAVCSLCESSKKSKKMFVKNWFKISNLKAHNAMNHPNYIHIVDTSAHELQTMKRLKRTRLPTCFNTSNLLERSIAFL